MKEKLQPKYCTAKAFDVYYKNVSSISGAGQLLIASLKEIWSWKYIQTVFYTPITASITFVCKDKYLHWMEVLDKIIPKQLNYNELHCSEITNHPFS